MKRIACLILLILCCCLVLPSRSAWAENSTSSDSHEKASTQAVYSAGFTTPEEYGAVGDGFTDDTDAWQKAIDSGKPVIAGSKKYKCGTIWVTQDAEINCGNAVFVCTEAVLFSCFGSAQTGTEEKDCKANSDYSLSDHFTGIVHIVGTNNIFKQREYYVGGSVEAFYDGQLSTQIPVDILGVIAYRLNPVQVNISNISDVLFSSEEKYKVVIKQQYCAFSVIENVNMSHACYSVIQFNQCFKCTYRDSHLDIPQYKEKGTPYYPIEILDTCYTKIENVFAHCVGWHCITTGNKTLCRGTKVTNCELYTDYAVPAYEDHSNGIETVIMGCTLSSVKLGALGKLINCDIVCCKDKDMCYVNLDMSSTDGLAHFILENCRLYPQSDKYVGVRVLCNPRDSGSNSNYYLNSLSVINCRNMNENVDVPIVEVVTLNVTGETKSGILNVINSNLSLMMNAEKIFISGN